jgi:hypothetical protein
MQILTAIDRLGRVAGLFVAAALRVSGGLQAQVVSDGRL